MGKITRTVSDLDKVAGQLAAERHYVEIFLNNVDKDRQIIEANWENPEELYHSQHSAIVRIWRYLSRTENLQWKKAQKAASDTKNLLKLGFFDVNQKNEIQDQLKKLETAEKQLVKAFSRYTGSVSNNVTEILNILRSLEKPQDSNEEVNDFLHKKGFVNKKGYHGTVIEGSHKLDMLYRDLQTQLRHLETWMEGAIVLINKLEKIIKQRKKIKPVAA